MSLRLQYSFCQDCGCNAALFSDTSGVYNPFTNPTGYSDPSQSPADVNTYSGDVTQARISILPPEYQDPIVFNFDILNGQIQSATRTDQFNNTVSLDIELFSNLNFPFFDFQFDSVLLFGDSAQSVLQDGVWYVSYSIVDPTQSPAADYEVEAFNYFICKSTRCKQDAAIKLPKGLITKSNALDIFLNYDSLINAVAMQNKEAVNSQIAVLDSLCKECGCC